MHDLRFVTDPDNGMQLTPGAGKTWGATAFFPASHSASRVAVLLSCGAFLTAFVAAPRSSHVSAPTASTGTAAALTAATLVTPQAAFADEGSVWIPALSAIGAGFAIGF